MAIQKYHVVLKDGTRGFMTFESKGGTIKDLVDTTVKVITKKGERVKGTLSSVVRKGN